MNNNGLTLVPPRLTPVLDPFCRPAALANRHFREQAFDVLMMGYRIYEQPFEVRITQEIPPARASTTPLGRHLDGCRIGFDLGGSDRKVAAVRNGECVFSEEVIWNPIPQSDSQCACHRPASAGLLRSRSRNLLF